MSRAHSYSHSSAHSPNFPSLHIQYVITHSPTLPSLYLRHSSFSNPSVTSPMSQIILQPFFRFSYVTSSSLNSPGRTHSPTFPSLHLRHNSFSNPSVASPTSQVFHLIHLPSSPWSCLTLVLGEHNEPKSSKFLDETFCECIDS